MQKMLETKYTPRLYKSIKKLNLGYSTLETGGLIICIYLKGCSTQDCAKLFDLTEEQIIDYLKIEEIYGYKVCSSCEKLRDRENDFRPKYKVCNTCKKEYMKEYYDNNYEINEITKKRNRQYYHDNKEQRKIVQSKYHQKNKDVIIKQKKKYNKEYWYRDASFKYVQKLTQFEEIKGNQVKCKYCGKWMTPTNQQVQTRLYGINNNDTRYIYCSDECKQECPVFGQVLYPKGFKSATSREVNPYLRQLVLARDNYTCQKCNKDQTKLTVGLHCHHIIPHINSPIETNDPDNCITLCKDCHKLVHKLPDCGYNELKCA